MISKDKTITIEDESDKESQNPISTDEEEVAGTPTVGVTRRNSVSTPTVVVPKPPTNSKKQPDPAIAALLDQGKGEMSSLQYATKLVDVLSQFVDLKPNVHKDIKLLVTRIQKTMLEVNKESSCREALLRKKATLNSTVATPQASSAKRKSSPQSNQMTPRLKAPRKDEGSQQSRSTRGETEWTVVGGNKSDKGKSDKGKSKKPTKPKPDKAPQPRNARLVRPKPDALLIEAKDVNSYADILRKVKADTDLKDLGSQVTRIRRTKNGGMLFELKGDPLVKSETYKELIAKSLGDQATVRALTQEFVVEVANLDEVTTELELREALIELFPPGEELESTASIKFRRAYGGTQIATIKLPVAGANLLLKAGKIKVGWTICQLRTPRTQLLRCYKCLGFGHVASKCTVNVNRSKCCWRCGKEGHVSKTCSNTPKCMLCQKGESNDHATGSLKCNAYLKAKANQKWK